MKKYSYIAKSRLGAIPTAPKAWKIPKHFPPASNEWKTAIFSYKKTHAIDAFGLDSIADSICRSYFSFYYVADKKMKSKRMRTLIRRLSMKRVFVSKPELKHTSDQVAVTSYIYDRESVFHKRKLFFIMRQFNRLNGFHAKLYIKKKKRKKIKKISRKFSKIRVMKQDLKKYQFFKRFMFGLAGQKVTFIRWLSHYYFFKWALSLFIIDLNITPILSMVRNEKGLLEEDVTGLRLCISKGNQHIEQKIDLPDFNLTKCKNLTMMLYKLLWYNISHIAPNGSQAIKLYQYLNESHLAKLEDDLLTGAYEEAGKQKDEENEGLILEFLKIEVIVLRYIHKIYSDYYFKFNYLIPELKSLLKRLYNKKVNINVIKLKYLYLNSDIISEAIATKLRKKTGRVLKVIRKSLGITKLPRLNINNIIVQKSKKDDSNPDSKKSNTILPTLITNVKKTFNSIKYKWMTGIRVEGKGRLTKRFTASRALFKYKYKGNLKNIEFINYVTPKRKSQSLYMLRGEHRPNVQHSFSNSRKRIGAYGIKTWLSSN